VRRTCSFRVDSCNRVESYSHLYRYPVVIWTIIMATSSWLRIAVVQFAPKLGEVHANIAKARELCRGSVHTGRTQFRPVDRRAD
jgi:hypothetical protein